MTLRSEGTRREDSYNKKESVAVADAAVVVGKVYTAGVVAFQGRHRCANPWPSTEGAISLSYFLWELPIGQEETNGQGSPLMWPIENLLRAERKVEKERRYGRQMSIPALGPLLRFKDITFRSIGSVILAIIYSF